MKKFLILLTLSFGITIMGLGQITGTAHDLSAETWNAEGEICIVCHTPHDAIEPTEGPLWNHDVSSATFTVYISPTGTLDATLGQPTGASLLCMSCHDGTVALDSYGGATGTNFATTGNGLVGTDLTDDHPISFTYNTALATTDGELFDPSSATTSLGGTIDDDLLIGGQMECSSCHDVHGTGNAYLLHIPNTASALCLTCHDK